jgi:hypothetical protein
VVCIIDLSDLNIGIYSAWKNQVYNPAITLSLNDFIQKLKLLGAKIIEIDIPDLKLDCIKIHDYSNLKNVSALKDILP